MKIKLGLIIDYTKDKRMFKHLGFIRFPQFAEVRNYVCYTRYFSLILPCITRDWERRWLRMNNNYLMPKTIGAKEIIRYEEDLAELQKKINKLPKSGGRIIV